MDQTYEFVADIGILVMLMCAVAVLAWNLYGTWQNLILVRGDKVMLERLLGYICSRPSGDNQNKRQHPLPTIPEATNVCVKCRSSLQHLPQDAHGTGASMTRSDIRQNSHRGRRVETEGNKILIKVDELPNNKHRQAACLAAGAALPERTWYDLVGSEYDNLSYTEDNNLGADISPRSLTVQQRPTTIDVNVISADGQTARHDVMEVCVAAAHHCKKSRSEYQTNRSSSGKRLTTV